jgi:hypothetical protein
MDESILLELYALAIEKIVVALYGSTTLFPKEVWTGIARMIVTFVGSKR